jgi:predicted  nucleic acid-binding Zn-ribbon protein
MTQAEALFALQEIDLTLIRNQKRLQELTAMLADNKGVSDAEAKVAEALKQLIPVQTQLRNLELEDHLLETMMAIEDGEKLLTDAQAQLNNISQAWENEHQQLIDEQSQLESEVKILRQKRERALEPISPENQQLYSSLRTKKNNQPISALDGNTCSVCGVEQTLAVMKNVRQGQGLIYCGNCGRILVAKS